jgi:hypothetical protein
MSKHLELSSFRSFISSASSFLLTYCSDPTLPLLKIGGNCSRGSEANKIKRSNDCSSGHSLAATSVIPDTNLVGAEASAVVLARLKSTKDESDQEQSGNKAVKNDGDTF